MKYCLLWLTGLTNRGLVIARNVLVTIGWVRVVDVGPAVEHIDEINGHQSDHKQNITLFVVIRAIGSQSEVITGQLVGVAIN